MISTFPKKVLVHPDLEIELTKDKKGEDVYVGRSTKYEPYAASGPTAYECFFKFNIQLAEQKVISGFLKTSVL